MAKIELEHVNLTFPVRRKVRMREFLKRLKNTPDADPLSSVHALQNVTLHIEHGQRIGIIGHNGAGKSTLLRVIAGIYPPTEGRRVVEGQISSLFKIELGFEPDATGWENIAYRGYLQGETPKSIKGKLQAIAEFSELGRFLEMPVRYYSSGMLVRLAFSIATAIEPEILLVDEVLSVGDMVFKEKARQRMREMMAKAHLIIVVTHDLDELPKLSDQCIWMDHGRLRQIGPVNEVIAAYRSHAPSLSQQAA